MSFKVGWKDLSLHPASSKNY